MAHRVPVVATAVEGLPLTLAEGRGVLVAPGEPAELAAAISAVLAGDHAIDLDGAQRYAGQFSPSRVAARYAQVYRRLLAAGDRVQRLTPPEGAGVRSLHGGSAVHVGELRGQRRDWAECPPRSRRPPRGSARRGRRLSLTSSHAELADGADPGATLRSRTAPRSSWPRRPAIVSRPGCET